MSEIDAIKRALYRERNARKAAERFMEDKSRKLYDINEELLTLNASLEKDVDLRTNEIKKSEAQLRVLFEKHPFPMLVYEIKTLEILDVNQTAITNYGYSKSDFLQMTVKDLHSPKDSLDEHFAKVSAGIFEIKEWQHYTKSREIIDVEISATSIEYNSLSARLVLMKDISEQKRIEKEQKLNERKYQDLVETVSDIIYRCDYKGKLKYINPTAVHTCEFTKEELMGKHFTEIIRDDFRTNVLNFYTKQLLDKTKSTYLEFPIITGTGKEIWIGQTVDIHQSENSKIEFIALARDITERKHIQEVLKKSEEKYRNIMENMHLGLLEVDNNEIITDVYPKFCQLSGYTKNELVGKHASKTLLPPEYIALMNVQSEKRIGGTPGVYEVELLKKNGDRVWVVISGAPYYDHNGQVVGSVGIHLDISNQKKIEQELREAKEIAEDSVKSKELFMANMSHEIRTPMNAIIGMGELLKKSALNQKQSDYVGAIKTSADNLLIIINDILDFSKIESGKLELELRPTDLPRLIDNIKKTIGLKAEEKGIEVKIHIPLNCKGYMIDSIRLSQILINLSGNAVKFTESGLISIICQVEPKTAQIDTLKFSVKDTGIGINESQIKNIFESFIQAEESTARKYGGTGLGLAISKQLVELMSGKLKVESTIGVGSDFNFTIDLEKVEIIEVKSDENKLDETVIKDLFVLLVEDHEINRFMAQTILENWQCKVDIAVNGLEAIEKVKSTTYDVILMDMRMPEMDGLEATRYIRKTLNIKTPIIALTANAIKGDSEKCAAVGMNDYISKPFKQDDLLEKLIYFKGDSHTIVKSKFTKKTAGSSKETTSLVDLRKLEQSTNGDKVFMKKMIELFLKDTPNQINNLKQEVTQDNFELIGKIAHRLKPSIDHLAHTSLQTMVREIEHINSNTTDNKHNVINAFLVKIEQLMTELKTVE